MKAGYWLRRATASHSKRPARREMGKTSQSQCHRPRGVEREGVCKEDRVSIVAIKITAP
jgi:hypothetical protein